MAKTVTVVMSEETYTMFKELKDEFKNDGKTVTELFKQMIVKFYNKKK
jgi:RNA:NAD 2'-phosphotransferase (TPT1/KptA family)